MITERRLETSGVQIPGSPHPHVALHPSNPAKPQGLGHSHQKGFLGSYGNLYPCPLPRPRGPGALQQKDARMAHLCGVWGLDTMGTSSFCYTCSLIRATPWLCSPRLPGPAFSQTEAVPC